MTVRRKYEVGGGGVTRTPNILNFIRSEEVLNLCDYAVRIKYLSPSMIDKLYHGLYCDAICILNLSGSVCDGLPAVSLFVAKIYILSGSMEIGQYRKNQKG